MVGVGETWRHLFGDCVIKVAGPEANNTCQDYQFCAGLIMGVDGAVHSVQAIWVANSST